MHSIARAILTTPRTTIASALVAITLLGATGSLEAQSRSAFGTGAVSATVHTSVGVTMPFLMQFRATTAPTATAQAEHFTEYTLRFNVRTNARWEVVAADLPAGVTILSVDGAWATDANALTLHRGVPTNGSEVEVRVRVADGADLDWQQSLKVEARRR